MRKLIKQPRKKKNEREQDNNNKTKIIIIEFLSWRDWLFIFTILCYDLSSYHLSSQHLIWFHLTNQLAESLSTKIIKISSSHNLPSPISHLSFSNLSHSLPFNLPTEKDKEMKDDLIINNLSHHVIISLSVSQLTILSHYLSHNLPSHLTQICVFFLFFWFTIYNHDDMVSCETDNEIMRW